MPNDRNALPEISRRILDLRSRLHLSQSEMAQYLGVPIYTLRKWETGEREPNSILSRLLDVLGLLEAMAPALHASFLPSESRHVEKSDSVDSIGSSADSVMSKNPV